MGNEPIQFPAWRYHKDGRSMVVQNPTEDAALKHEDGWADRPFPTPTEGETQPQHPPHASHPPAPVTPDGGHVEELEKDDDDAPKHPGAAKKPAPPPPPPPHHKGR